MFCSSRGLLQEDYLTVISPWLNPSPYSRDKHCYSIHNQSCCKQKNVCLSLRLAMIPPGREMQKYFRNCKILLDTVCLFLWKFCFSDLQILNAMYCSMLNLLHSCLLESKSSKLSGFLQHIHLFSHYCNLVEVLFESGNWLTFSQNALSVMSLDGSIHFDIKWWHMWSLMLL